MKNELRRFFFLGISIFIVLSSQAKSYYISSSSGSDANSGTIDAPWKTIDKVNSQTFLPGDQILFKRGDTWTGTVLLKNSIVGGNPIIYDAYGAGNKPVIKGTTEVSGWTKYSGNIYKATLNTRTNQVFVDGVKLELSKSTAPNPISWFKVTSKISNTTFTSDNLKGKDWTGAYLAFRLVDWSLQTRKVISSNSSTGQVTLDGELRYTLSTGSPFFVINSINVLSSAGQWSYDEASNALYVWTPNGDSPANHSVEASTIDYGFYGHNLNGITIKNLNIKGFNKDGVNVDVVDGQVSYSDRVIVDHCDLTDNYRVATRFGFNSSGNALGYTGATNCEVTYNNISGSSEKGVAMWSGAKSGGTISFNTIRNIGLYEDIGLDGFVYAEEAAVGIYAYVTNGIVSHNTVQNIGLNGIWFGNTGVTVEYNRISSCDLSLHDGGGIYTYGKRTGSVIRNNIISDIGSTDGWYDNGIYMDASTDGVTIENNTVFNCTNPSSFGIFLSHTSNSRISGNIIYGNTKQLYAWSSTSSNASMLNNVMQNNVFYSIDMMQSSATFNLIQDAWTSSVFVLGGNAYYNAENLSVVNFNDKSFTIESFREFSGETNAKGFQTLLNCYENVVPTSQNLIENSTFDSDKSAWGGYVTWDNTQLNNGCLKATIPSGRTNSLFYTTINQPVSDLVRLSYDVVAPNASNKGDIFVNSVRKAAFVSDKTNRHFEHIFNAETADKIFIQYIPYGNDGESAYFDNVKFEKITATEISAKEKSKLFYNDTNAAKSIQLIGTYKDLDGNIVTGSITLQPFTSRILIKQDSAEPVNQAPKINGQSFNILDVKQAGDFIGQVVASDPDAGQTLTYSIVSGNTSNLFSLNSTTGELSANTKIQFTTPATLILTVKVTDNASTPLSAQANVTVNIQATLIQDTSNPIVTSFTIPSTSTSLTIPVTSFSGTDNTRVSAYILTETSTPPNVGDSGWSSSAPTSYTFSDYGTKNLYAWVKDDAGNLSGYVKATVIITNNTAVYSTEDVTICEGETYLEWTDAGQYERTLVASSGADSIVTTNLYVNPSYHIVENITIKEGENYLGLTNTGSYSRTLTTSTGCDSIITTNLTVLEPVYATEDINICAGESYLGRTTSSQFERTLEASTGADSIITTFLYVNPVYNLSEDIVIKEGDNYEGWNSSGSYTRALSSVNGCDSIIITNLTVLPTIYTIEEVSICEGETYQGLTTSGQYERTLDALNGADSVITTYLTVNPVYHITENISINEGDSYQSWTTSGQYVRTLSSVTGCDSIVTTFLTVAQQDIYTVENVNICSGESYLGWTVSGEYERILKSAGGADSIVTTNLYVNPAYNVSEDIQILEGENYLGWDISGSYTRTLTSETGCDSVVTTNLVVLQPSSSVEEIAICDGESYLGWTKSGIYERTLQSSNGTDSVVTTYLVVNPVYHISEDITINEGETYLRWNASGTYVRTLTSISGCDSIVTTRLTVIPVVTGTTLTQEINLTKKWNIFSSYVTPKGLDMEAVLSDLKASGALVQVIDENGNTYEKSGGEWVNNIGDFSVSDGYQILVNNNCNLRMEGQKVALPFEINLNKGWNIISFPYTEVVVAMEVIQPLIDQGVLVKVQNEKGKSIEYWDNRSQWVNSIGNFVPGEGYLLNVSQDCSLTILDSYTKGSLFQEEEETLAYFELAYTGNGHNHMNIYLDLSNSGFEAGDEIAAFDGDICVGAVKLTESNILSSSAGLVTSYTDEGENNGFSSGNGIVLLAWKQNDGHEIEPIATVTDGKMLFEKGGSVFVEFSNAVQVGIDDINRMNIEMYPNPASDHIYLQLSGLPSSDTKVTITDMAGKTILVKNLESDREKINIQSFNSGIYLVNVWSRGIIKNFKLVKQ